MEKHATTLEMIQTDCARLSERLDEQNKPASVNALPRIPSKTPKVAGYLDLSSEEMATWFTTKITAAYETPAFIKKVKGLIRDKLQTHTISVANISEAAQYSIKQWSTDAISGDIGKIMECNADVVVSALKKELQSALAAPSSSGVANDKVFKDAVQKALKLVQDQLNDQKTEIQKISVKNSQSDISSLMSIWTVKSIFTDFSTAAVKVLENLKLWSHLEPAKVKECTDAARNLLDFQKSKGYLIDLFFNLNNSFS